MSMVLDLIQFLLKEAPSVAPLLRQWMDLRGLRPPDPKAWDDVDREIDRQMARMRFVGDPPDTIPSSPPEVEVDP